MMWRQVARMKIELTNVEKFEIHVRIEDTFRVA